MYRFKEKGHVHELLVDGEWKKLTGVTTILGIIAKPSLIQWAANMAVEYVKDKWGTNGLTKENLFIVLEEAKSAHRHKKEEAGQKGTDVHTEIEAIIKGAIKNFNGIVQGYPEIENNEQIKHFCDWATTNKVKFLESEVHIYSKDLFIGGICDFVCEIDGQAWIGDIKTGSGIYPEHFFQTAGYQIMFEEMKKYQNITGHLILNLKKTGEFDEKRSVSNEDNKQAFLSALSLYRIQQKVQNQII